jgi:hypothetical protein
MRGIQSADNFGPAPSPLSELAQEYKWPIISSEAFHGLAGEVVQTITPHSEADPAAILIQFLAATGNVIGRSKYYQIESDRHHPNLYAVLVGPSAKARKGTSWGRVRSVMKTVDPQWVADRTKSGLSSGEGFIYGVRDEQPDGIPRRRPLKLWIGASRISG